MYVSEQTSTSWSNPDYDVPKDQVYSELAKVRVQPGYEPPFVVVKRRVIDEQEGNECRFEATVSVKIKGMEDLIFAAGSGRGLICSLEIALRNALIPYFPSIEKIAVVSYVSHTLPNGFEGLDADAQVVLGVKDANTGRISLLRRIAISESGACEMVLADYYELCCLADLYTRGLCY